MKKIYLTITAIIATCLIYAQSPGGVSSSSNLQVWLDADQLGLSDGQKVSSWTDMSGNSNSATNGSSTRQPIFQSNQINGRASIIFSNATNTFLKTPAISAMNTGTISSFVVFDGSTANHQGMLLGGKYLEQNQFFMMLRNNSLLKSWVLDFSSNQIKTEVSNNSSYQILGSSWDAGTGVLQTYKNGGSFSSGASVTDIPSGNKYYVIGANPGTFNYNYNGGIAEVILYSSALNSAERIIVENYLGAKYGLSISNDFYSYESTHAEDLIGIGQESDGSNSSAASISTIQVSNMSTPGNGDYVMLGHDGVGLTPANNSDVPTAGWARYGRVWRAGITGTPGTVDVTFDISQVSLGFPDSYVLLVDGDGVFASGATPYVGVYDGGSQTVTFTGVTLSDGDYVALANSNVNILSTGVTTDWHTTTTWNCGCVPVLSSQVEVLTGHTVEINGQNASSGELLINGTLSMLSSDTLTLNANFTNNGTFNEGTGTVLFEKTDGAQTIDGSQTFYNLSIDNSAGVSIASGTTSVQGFLDVVNGNFTTNNSLIMLSNSSGSGTFKNPSTGTISGSVTVQRYLNEGETWYLLTSPLTDANIEDWNNEFEMQGFLGTEWPGAPTGSFYYYNESSNVTSYDDGWTEPTNTTDILTNTVGWTAYIATDSYGGIPRTIDLTGTPKLGDGITVSGTYNANIGDPTKDGWNLVGNPYQSPVRFSNVAKSANYDLAYRQNSTGQKVAIQNTTIIAPGEGFWLHCLGGDCNLTFDAVDVNSTNDDNYNLKTSQNAEELIVDLKYDNEEDNVMIRFNNLATSAYDKGLDGYKLSNSFAFKPNISVVNSQNHDLFMAAYQDDFEGVLPLRIYTENPSNTEKSYSLQFNNVDAIKQNNKYLVLEDRFLNTFTPLTEGYAVNFMMYDSVTIPRFYLHVNSPLTLTKSDVTCYNQNNGQISVVGAGVGPFDYTLYDEFMDVVSVQNNVNGTALFTGLEPGQYKVVVSNNDTYGEVADVFSISEPSIVSANFDVTLPDQLLNGYFELGPDTITVNQNQLIQFGNLSSGGSNFTWDFGDFSSSNLSSPEHMYFSGGIYKVTLTVSNAGCQDVVEQYFKVNELTSINETNLFEDITVLVNKNEIMLYLNNQEVKNVTISLNNTLGQNILAKKVVAGINHQEKLTVNTARGIYLLSIKDELGNIKTKKIVLGKE